MSKVNTDLKEITEKLEERKIESSDDDSVCSSGSSDHLSNHESSPGSSPVKKFDKSIIMED